MAIATNRQILLKSRPTAEPAEDNFELIESPIPEPAEGEYLARTIYLSLDPYMRGRMSGRKSYTEPAELGKVMIGATVGQVVTSRNPDFAEGDIVLGYDGWQEYAVSNGQGARKLDPSQAPISYALGVLGMPGLTAYSALLDVGQPKAGRDRGGLRGGGCGRFGRRADREDQGVSRGRPRGHGREMRLRDRRTRLRRLHQLQDPRPRRGDQGRPAPAGSTSISTTSPEESSKPSCDTSTRRPRSRSSA